MLTAIKCIVFIKNLHSQNESTAHTLSMKGKVDKGLYFSISSLLPDMPIGITCVDLTQDEKNPVEPQSLSILYK